jgi:hypothetical protein
MRRAFRWARAAAGALAALLAAACLGDAAATEPKLTGTGQPVLFIGNSLTYVNDIPGIVQALADSAGGQKLDVTTVAGPDMALIDHWNEGSAVREIRKGSWKWVVLQQGPSSVEVNRDTLRLSTKLFAGEIAAIGGRPALFSAWPSLSRRQDFARAIESYRLAAEDVGGLMLPVASAWLATWERDANARLYADDLHPSVAGAYVSALVIYARLLEKSPVGLPSTLRLRSGALVSVDPSLALTLQRAAADVTTPSP